MKKYIAAACGAALVIAAGFAAAQPQTPDRKGEQSQDSAKPIPGKSNKEQPNVGSGGKGTATKPPMANPDAGGEQSADSAKPKKK